MDRPPAPQATWYPPPLWAKYRAVQINFGRKWRASQPTVVIFNKYCTEFKTAPFNCLQLEYLQKIVHLLLKLSINVVYKDGHDLHWANKNTPSSITDLEWFNSRRTKGRTTTTLANLAVYNPTLSFNEMQMGVLAQAPITITIQGGGTGIMPGYFASDVIVFHKRGRELTNGNNLYNGMLERFAGANYFVANTEQTLLQLVEERVALVNQAYSIPQGIPFPKICSHVHADISTAGQFADRLLDTW
jgi:hypothetical protein